MTETVTPWLRGSFQDTGREASIMLVAFAEDDVLADPSLDVAAPMIAPVSNLDVRTRRYADDPEWLDSWRTGALRTVADARLSDPARLDAATHCYTVRVDLDDPADLTHLQLAWAVATALSGKGCFAVLDAHAGHWLDGAEVAELPADRPFVVQREVSLTAETTATPGFGHAVHTRGMRKFARPDLITGAPADRIEYTAMVLSHLARMQAEGALLTEGQVFRFDGSHTVQLVAYEPDGRVPQVNLNNDGLLLLDV